MLKKENSSYCLQLEELDNEVRIMRMELQALDAQLREKE